MELRQACTGFANSLQIAIPRIAMLGKPVAIVGSETGSVYFDYQRIFWTDLSLSITCKWATVLGGSLWRLRHTKGLVSSQTALLVK